MRKNKKINLLEGDILNKLILLSAPLMATAFVNMAYNMTDTAWLGRLGKGAVAASGAAHFFVWIASSIILISRIGTSVDVAQEYGANRKEKMNNSIKNGFILLVISMVIYTLIVNLFSNSIIGFYNLEPRIHGFAISYLNIMSLGFIIMGTNILFSSIYYSLGNSFYPFIANVIGLMLNIILDPLFIFGIGPFQSFGVAGAAYASVISQIVVLLILTFDIVRTKNEIYYGILKGKFEISDIVNKFKIGIPVGIMNMFHAIISMILVKFISEFGTTPMAALSVGSQIESLTWMTSEGLGGGIISFVGQNYGAKKFDRLNQIIKKSITFIAIVGISSTAIIIGFRYQLFNLFVPNDPVTLETGAKYLLILGFSQLFMAIEIGVSGIFNGLGKTRIPSTISIIFNALRVPMAYILMQYYGYVGVYSAISISSILKGTIILYFLKRNYNEILTEKI